MTGMSCPREAEVVRVVRAEAQPAEGTELAAHLASCSACREAVALAAAFRSERDVACAEARPPAPGLVWWKAELRGRREQACAAARPILVANGVALAAVLAATAVLGAWLAPRAVASVEHLSGWPRPALDLPLPRVDVALLAQPGILLAAATALMLTALALYLALSRE